MGVALSMGGGAPWGHIQTIYGNMMNVKYVWNFDADMDIQKFLRYRRNFCTPNMPLAAINTLGGGGTPPRNFDIGNVHPRSVLYTEFDGE